MYNQIDLHKIDLVISPLIFKIQSKRHRKDFRWLFLVFLGFWDVVLGLWAQKPKKNKEKSSKIDVFLKSGWILQKRRGLYTFCMLYKQGCVETPKFFNCPLSELCKHSTSFLIGQLFFSKFLPSLPELSYSVTTLSLPKFKQE